MDKGYSLAEIYGKPEHFNGLKRFGKRLVCSTMKVSFFVVLLYGVWMGLNALNEAVQTGAIYEKHIPVFSPLKEKIDGVTYETHDLASGYEDLAPSEREQTKKRGVVPNLLSSITSDLVNQFASFVDMANNSNQY